MFRAKKLIVKSEFDEKGKWSNSKFKNLLYFLLSYYILDSIFDKIIIITLSNRVTGVTIKDL